MVSMEELDQWWVMKAIKSIHPVLHRHRCQKCRQLWKHDAICSSASGHHLVCKDCAGPQSHFAKGYWE